MVSHQQAALTCDPGVAQALSTRLRGAGQGRIREAGRWPAVACACCWQGGGSVDLD